LHIVGGGYPMTTADSVGNRLQQRWSELNLSFHRLFR
jgi:hypothetical protein